MKTCRFITGLFILLVSVAPTAVASTIHDAARSGDLEQVQRLALDGVSVNERTLRSETPLIVAAIAGQGEVVSYLLQRGADIDLRNDSGLSALHAAAYAGHVDIVKLLVARKARINDAENVFGVTPLHLASEENRIDTVRVLLELGADPTALEVNGYTSMTRAGWREHWEVVDTLLAYGASCQPADKVGDWLYERCAKRANAN